MRGLDRIAAVSFDVGGTLIAPWPSVGHVYAAVAAAHGYGGLPPETLDRQFAAAWQRRGAFDYSHAAWQWIVQETFTGLLDRQAAAALLEPLYHKFEQADAWRIYDDVRPTLEALRSRGFRLAVISNWDERLRPLLRNLGLAQFFDVITVSIEAGVAKPAPGIFQRCIQALGLPAAAVLHVGDDATDDLHGARQAGLQALRIVRGPAADGEPDDLRRLDQLLERLEAS